jgi:hypothetical protein
MKAFCCLIMFALTVHVSNAFAGLYSVGFQWDWYVDWTPRPASDFGTTNGNPGNDQHGNPVYSFEYTMGLTASNRLGSPSPWYSHTTGRMQWDNNWYGQTPGVWVYADNTLPDATGTGRSFTPSGAPVLRWINPTGESIFVDYGIGPGVSNYPLNFVQFIASPNAMDLAICLDHGIGPAGIELLYSTTIVTPPGASGVSVANLAPISLHDIVVQPGESVFVTTIGYASPYIDSVFAPTITLVSGPVAPVPAPDAILLGILGLGTAGWRLRRRVL